VAAFSLIDLIFALGIAATLAAVGVPSVSAGLDDLRANAAARYVSGRLQQVRMQAIRRNAGIAMRFTQDTAGFHFEMYADGNGNGVLTRDIQSGVDPSVSPVDRLSDRFKDVEFGALAGLPSVDPGGTPPGIDPIRFGVSDMAVFTATGTSSSGSVYLLSRGGAQYAVRVYGETGRTRILKFHPGSGLWTPISGVL
jgi:type II secretory pathway pseudopilin PulG